MKRQLWLIVALLLCGVLLVGHAADSVAGGEKPEEKPAPPATKATPGLAAAQALSTITGVAISPLLGVSGVGCWKYWKTAPDQRGGLPWFAQPWFWIPGLLLVTIVFVKDVSGAGLPTALKKPFDVAEVFENKLSALIAAGFFVPLVASIFGDFSSENSFFSEAGLAVINVTSLLNIAAVALAIMAFLVVWLVAHVINVLILISPFGTVDAVLKAARLFLLSTVAATSLANPYIGALLSLVIILICWALSGWAMRLMVFGNVFAWDLLTLRQKRFKPGTDPERVFTARRMEKVPIRTYGKLSRDDQGRLVVRYRRWLVLPARVLTLPAATYAVGRGLLNPEIVQVQGEWTKSMLTLPPRYLTHEEEVARFYELSGVRDIGMIKGIKALWQWAKGRFSYPSPAAPVVADSASA
jgi:MFS family permease